MLAVILFCMDLVALTRQLVDIESITGNEAAVGEFLFRTLTQLGLQVERMDVPAATPTHVASSGVEGSPAERFNVYAFWPETPAPAIVFSTHIDTVPPFIPSFEDAERIYGRGSCDAKGILAAQVGAALRLHADGINVGLLFVVGEERDSTGAIVANGQPRGARFLVNGEPTDNKLAIASKGSLRVEITARGRMAHSAYPELGESAIDKLLEALRRLKAMDLPNDPDLGLCTMNIGVIEGGRAPNVIPDFARALLLCRLVGPSEDLKRDIAQAVDGLAEVQFPLDIPLIRMRTVEGLPTMVAAFTTDIPALSNWGQPLLLGPGSIHVAHTEHEYLEKKQLFEAVDLYTKIATKLARS
ncbi:MAG TPA: M20/M25/M40 family metallo-hydrolase [Terriglobales bacterium]|nr:M20/M25/M40 family metallo-hydrolase [Terriglobales bacterium]